MKPAQTYRIETPRLVIRCYHPQDAPLLKDAIDASLPHLLPWMAWAKYEPESVEAKADRIRKFRGEFDLGIDYTFGIFSKDEQVLIGSTGLHTRIGDQAREIGYWIHAEYVNQGFATETVQALVKVGFEIEKLKRLEIRVDPENMASNRIPEKLGFTHEATLRDRMKDVHGKPRDAMIWSLFQADYQASDLQDFKIKAFNMLGEEIVIE